MDEQDFWYIISESLEEAEIDRDLQLAKLKELLQLMADEDIIAFQEMVDHMMNRCYLWEVWGAAYIMYGGLNDEQFEGFRAGLILKGKDIFEAACSDPDSLAEGEEIEECEEFLLLACEVYEERNEDGGIYDRFREDGPLQPGGEPVDEQDTRLLRTQYPRLWEKYGEEAR